MFLGEVSWANLSRQLLDGITPHLESLGFSFEDKPDDDLIYTVVDDSPRYRNYYRSSSIGNDFFAFRFSQYMKTDLWGKGLGVGVEMGIHVAAFEALEIQLNAVRNPYRIGKRLPAIFTIKDDLIRIYEQEQISEAVDITLKIVKQEGEPFWASYKTLDRIQDWFETLPKMERHSPKGGSIISHYLLLISYLRNDQDMFTRVVKEYRPYLQDDEVYQSGFEDLVSKLIQKFGSE